MKDLAEGQLLRRRRTRHATITDYAYAARLKMPTHFHEPAQISMVLTGGFEESIGSDHWECGPNKVLFRPAAREHAVRFGNTRTRILNLQLSTTSRITQSRPRFRLIKSWIFQARD